MDNSVLEKSSQEGLWWWWQWYGWWWHGHGCCRSSCCYWPCQGSGQVQLWRFWRWLWRLLNSPTHCADLVTENGHKELQGTKFAVMSGQFLQAKVLIGCPCAVLTGCICTQSSICTTLEHSCPLRKGLGQTAVEWCRSNRQPFEHSLLM